ncbi:MBL fold metallo-hydrolase [bacterium]|nr:MBL fold metallo-hydrolase [bacterium]
MTLSIKFLGATGTVTGSRYLLTLNDKRIMIDCGMFQGLKDLRLRNWEPFPVDPEKIDAILITHAHLDHSGYLPRLVKLGFKGKVFATHSTTALCNILFPDAAHIQEEDAEFLNRHKLSKHKPALPLYTLEDAREALQLFHPVDWDKTTAEFGFKFRFLPISHLLGASFIAIEADGKKIVFSGDIGRDKDPILPERYIMEKTDYIVCESTYGNRLHPEGDVKEELAEVISKTINRGGTVLIPSFAVGRSQALIYLINQLKLHGRIPDVPVYLNSPMAIEATKTHFNFANELKMPKEKLIEALKDVTYAKTPNQSEQIDKNKTPKIVISASGMLVGGRILHHLKSMGPDPKNSIVLVGFQAAGTRGEALVKGKKELKIHGQMIPIEAEVHAIQNLSGHADYTGILEWLSHFKNRPQKVFITHGEPKASEAMKEHIVKQFQWDTVLPQYKEEFTL